MTTALHARGGMPYGSDSQTLVEKFQLGIAAALLALIVGTILAFGGVYPAETFCLEAGSALLCSAWLCTELIHTRLRFTAKLAYLPLLVLGLLVLTQLSTKRTAYWYASFQESLLWTAYLLIFFIGSEAFSKRRAASLTLIVLSALGPLLALFALIQHFAHPGKIYWTHTPLESSEFIFGPYVNRNHYAGVIELLAPFAVVTLWDKRFSSSRRVLYGVGAAIMYASVFVSASRAGVLCCIAEWGLLACLGRLRNVMSGRRTIAWLLVLALSFVGFLTWLNPMGLVQRAGVFSSGGDLIEIRPAIYADAFRMLRVHPWLGFGLHTFPSVYPAFCSFHTSLIVNELHNDILQVFVELGVIGGTALLTFLGLVLVPWGRIFRERDTSRMRMVRDASQVGISAMLLHSLFDFNMHIPANAALFFLLCAFATNTSTRRLSRGLKGQRSSKKMGQGLLFIQLL